MSTNLSWKEYCYLPLYIFAGQKLLCARLRTADCDASAGSVEELDRIITQIRQQWPDVHIIVRGDSGFCREAIMSFLEENKVDYVFGLAKNNRLIEEIIEEILDAYDKFQRTLHPARFFRSFIYRTRDSWSRSRRVIGKAECLEKGDNPRFIVTSFSEDYDGQWLYEKFYCARGEMENRIKEQQWSLFADRTSSNTMRANQLRLWFSSVAYVFLELLRHEGLKETTMKTAQCGTLRLKLLKIGAFVRITTRRIVVSLASGYPYERYFAIAYHNLKNAVPLRV